MKQSAIELLEAMCEETHTGTAKLVQSIFKGVDIDALHNTLVYFYRLSQDPQMVSSCTKLDLRFICNCCIYRKLMKKTMMQKGLLLELTMC